VIAGPVGTDQTDLFAFLKRRGSFDEQNLVANLLADVVETDHVHSGMGIGAWKSLRRSYSMWRAGGRVFRAAQALQMAGSLFWIEPARRVRRQTDRATLGLLDDSRAGAS
jgi:hypothetical protein